mmetsp:Transcript_57270/g.133932  ORF Transcript_57270/g.133932 Transcript_57270/m.133932 type:complete len:216 (-) Transcript_57270:64-711(-)
MHPVGSAQKCHSKQMRAGRLASHEKPGRVPSILSAMVKRPLHGQCNILHHLFTSGLWEIAIIRYNQKNSKTLQDHAHEHSPHFVANDPHSAGKKDDNRLRPCVEKLLPEHVDIHQVSPLWPITHKVADARVQPTICSCPYKNGEEQQNVQQEATQKIETPCGCFQCPQELAHHAKDEPRRIKELPDRFLDPKLGCLLARLNLFSSGASFPQHSAR